MDLNGKRVFLAGATGMVGASVLAHLLEAHPGARIRAVRQSARPLISDPRVEQVAADLRDADEARRAAAGCDVAVMAAAAHAGGAAALAAAPARQVTDNAVMHARLLEALHAQGVQRVVWIGSVTLYQEFEGAIREDALDLNQDPPASHFGVGWVMRFSEKLCQFWRAQGGMAIINIRSANVFGPYARFDPRGSNFIPALIRKAVDRMDPFEVWGSPGVARDVIYAADFARAVGLLLTDDAIPGGVFNVGSGAPVTVGQVVEWALRSAGHAPSEIRYRDDRPTTIRFRSLDCSRIRAATGWAPQHTVEEGIRLTTDWWMRNKDWWTK